MRSSRSIRCRTFASSLGILSSRELICKSQPQAQAPNPHTLARLCVAGICALASRFPFRRSLRMSRPRLAPTCRASVTRIRVCIPVRRMTQRCQRRGQPAPSAARSARAWGVELEFVRSGRSHRSQNPIISPLAGGVNIGSVTSILSGGVLPVGIPISSPVNFQTDVRSSHSDLDAVLWARQRVGRQHRHGLSRWPRRLRREREST